MEFKWRPLVQIANMICGNADASKFFVYRTGSDLTFFFEDIGTDYEHDGSTRSRWVVETLMAILAEPQPSANMPPDTFARSIPHLMDQAHPNAAAAVRPRPPALL